MTKNYLILAIFIAYIPAFSSAQKGSISGRLVDNETLEPIPGIPVVKYGTTYGSTTDLNGQFTLEKLQTQTTELIISGNTLSGQGEAFYPMSIRNIPLDRGQNLIHLGDIRMIKKSVLNPSPLYMRVDFSSLPYTFEDGSERNMDGLYVLVDFDNHVPMTAETTTVPPDTVETFFSHRHKDGANELRKYLASRPRYPQDAAENGIVGLSIASCTIDRDGHIHDVSIINSLSPSVDQDIIRLLNSTEGQWTKIEIDTLETFYAQFFFVQYGNQFNTNELTAFNVLKSVVITAMGNPIEDSELYTDDQIAISLNESLNTGNYNEAIWYLDEAIRRNPYNPELYQVRIIANKKLGNKELVMEDVYKIGNFMNGKSIQSVISGD